MARVGHALPLSQRVATDARWNCSASPGGLVYPPGFSWGKRSLYRTESGARVRSGVVRQLTVRQASAEENRADRQVEGSGGPPCRLLENRRAQVSGPSSERIPDRQRGGHDPSSSGIVNAIAADATEPKPRVRSMRCSFRVLMTG